MRVLTLDGGGVRGAFGAAFLAHVEEHLGRGNLVEHFDLVCGTSTGAILALGLAAGISAAQVLDAYRKAGPEIFPSSAGVVRRLWGPAHSNAALEKWLRSFLGQRTLEDAVVPVAIPAYDASTGTPRVWKTNHHRDLHSGGGKYMWEVALASAAAPTYLPATQVAGAGAYLDGGLWANNPGMVGLVEARRFFGASFDDVSIVSIGTGRRKTWHELGMIRNRGVVGWGSTMLDVILDAQSEAVHQQLGLLLREESYVRVDVELPEEISLDDSSKIDKLVHIGGREGENRLRGFKAFLERNPRRAQP